MLNTKVTYAVCLIALGLGFVGEAAVANPVFVIGYPVSQVLVTTFVSDPLSNLEVPCPFDVVCRRGKAAGEYSMCGNQLLILGQLTRLLKESVD